MYLIKVYIEDEEPLFFRVKSYSVLNNRFIFVDTKTGLVKDFPSDKCSAEEVNP